ncbi:MAG: RDD family protein [Desulfobulbales bacterium]|nr:RDD family protein [Desulfobulbales bacterium]
MTPSSYPTFGARAVAFAIDSALLAIIHFFVFFLTTGRLFNDLVHIEDVVDLSFASGYLVLFFASFVFLHMVYYISLHSWTGQTIGKMIMGIRVVSTGRELIPPAVAFLRWAGYILSLFPLAAGFLWTAVDKDHCAWHDRLAQTRVVSAEMT